MPARLLAKHLYNIIRTTDILSPVDPVSLGEQLSRFGIQDESGQLRFARSAGVNLVVRGRIENKNSGLILDLYAFGLDLPHNGRMIYRYTATIPLMRPYGARDYSYICEEHAGRFLSGLFGVWRNPVRARSEGGVLHFPGIPDGRYGFYRQVDGDDSPVRIGEIEVHNQVAGMSVNGQPAADNDVIFIDHRKEADFLSDFYYGRKREIVLGTPDIEDTLLTVVLTAPASASMPLAAPVLGYYRSGDWTGLGLWAVNAAPWLFLEGRGFFNRPGSLRDEHRKVPSSVRTGYVFAWYFGVAGGVSLFVDAFSHSYLREASDYNGKKMFMGNRATAIYLSLVSGGGGHFYKGHRMWGYLYFHLNNILMYGTIMSFLPEQHYDSSTGKYHSDSINTRNAILFCTALGIAKTVEIIHLLYQKDNIDNGTVHETFEPGVTLSPYLSIERDEGLVAGLGLTSRF